MILETRGYDSLGATQAWYFLKQVLDLDTAEITHDQANFKLNTE